MSIFKKFKNGLQGARPLIRFSGYNPSKEVLVFSKLDVQSDKKAESFLGSKRKCPH
jgi:hypothetical protein